MGISFTQNKYERYTVNGNVWNHEIFKFTKPKNIIGAPNTNLVCTRVTLNR